MPAPSNASLTCKTSEDNHKGPWSRLLFWRRETREDEPDKSWMPLVNNVSKFHAIEAQERYWILRREIEMNLENISRALGDGDIEWRFNVDNGLSIDQHIEDIQNVLKEDIKTRYPGGSTAANQVGGRAAARLLAGFKTLAPLWADKPIPGHNRNGAAPGRSERGAAGELTPYFKFLRLLYYYKIILKNRVQLTRKYQDLNLLWRDMNFIRTRLLTDGLIDVTRVPLQLDFCRIEARNLALAEDPDIKGLLEQAAEEINVSAKPSSESVIKARRYIITLMTKLNDFRIRRMYEQLYKKRMYMLLCFVLLFLSLVCFEMQSHLTTAARPAGGSNNAELAATGDRVRASRPPADARARNNEAGLPLTFLDRQLRRGEQAFLWCTTKISSNPLIFIFFAGFTGGIFSNMMRFQPRNQLPGDEIYIFWYRITKPVIGAFGAMVLFIILTSGVLKAGIDAVFAKDMIKTLVDHPLTPAGFAFGFIMGFSERVILPKLK